MFVAQMRNFFLHNHSPVVACVHILNFTSLVLYIFEQHFKKLLYLLCLDKNSAHLRENGTARSFAQAREPASRASPAHLGTNLSVCLYACVRPSVFLFARLYACICLCFCACVFACACLWPCICVKACICLCVFLC
jgi:hypothetical protein